MSPLRKHLHVFYQVLGSPSYPRASFLAVDSLFLRLTDLEKVSESISKAIVLDPAFAAEEPDIDEDLTVADSEDVESSYAEKPASKRWRISP